MPNRAFMTENISRRTVRAVLNYPETKTAVEDLALLAGVSTSAWIAKLIQDAVKASGTRVIRTEYPPMREATTERDCSFCHAHRDFPPFMLQFGVQDRITPVGGTGNTEWFPGVYCNQECYELAKHYMEGADAFDLGLTLDGALERVERAKTRAARVRAEAFLKGYKKAMPPPEPPITATERARREREAKVQERHDKENAKARELRGRIARGELRGKPAPMPAPEAPEAPVKRRTVPVVIAPAENPADYPAPTGMPKAWGAALEGYGGKK